MKTGAEDKRKTMYAGILGVIAVLVLAYELYGFFGPSSPAPQPAAPVIVNATGKPTAGPAAQKIGVTSAQLDPSLHMEAMLVTESLAYSGSGRNIFAPGSPELIAEIPLPKAPARQVITTPTQTVAQGPVAPVLPPINLKFFGTSTSANGTRRAFLLNGDDVFVASAGDVVQRRYRIISIDANKISVEDLPNSNKQTLPLVGPP